MFMQACLNGSRPPGDHDALPLTPDEIARDAQAVAEAGAVAVHVHPRGRDGLESLEPEHCDAAVAALRAAAPKLEVSLSTCLWITGGDVGRRLECVRAGRSCPTGLERDGIELTQLHHGYDHTTWAVLDAAVRRRREVRIGFEDTYWLPDARRASSNAELVAAAAERYVTSG